MASPDGEDEDPPYAFLNYYHCDRCGHEWTDEWSCQCDDDCPECGARHMTPYKSDDLGGNAASAATTFKEVGEARYDEMLGVLPPALWIDKGFLVGEPFDHRRCKATGRLTASYSAFIRYRGKFYESEEAMTAAEFKAFDPSTLS